MYNYQLIWADMSDPHHHQGTSERDETLRWDKLRDGTGCLFCMCLGISESLRVYGLFAYVEGHLFLAASK